MIELKSPSWQPPRAAEALPCTDIAQGGEVVAVTLAYLAPGEVHSQQIVVSPGDQRTIMVGAEFQRPSARGDKLFIHTDGYSGSLIPVNLAEQSVSLATKDATP